MFPRIVVCAIVSISIASAAQDRIVAQVDPARTVALVRHVHPALQSAVDNGPVDDSLPITYATLFLKPADGLEAFLAEQQNPASPNYHKWLTPEQFGERFGASDADIAKVRAWLEGQGLRIHDVARGRHWITFSGTAGTVGRAFQTQIHRYTVNGQPHFANAAAPRVPAAFEPVIAGVDGLTDFVPQPLHVKASADPDPLNNSGSSHFLSPDDMAVIFNINPLYKGGIDGSGQKIAVIGRTDISLNDIRLFRTKYGLPTNDPKIVLVGPDPGTSSGDLTEADIDLEWSGAIARNAQIIYVNSTSVNTSAQYAVDQNLAPVMTYSYGSCEPEVAMNQRGVAQQANAQGITWFVSSGDSGAATCDRNAPTPQATKGATVAFPASLPEVTAVGGTGFNEGTASGYWASTNSSTGASALQYIPEKVWNDSSVTGSLEGSGGGASNYFPKPAWQFGPGVPDDGARDVPDISFPSSPQHWGYLVYTGGVLAVYGGTSVASPALAGVTALLNQSLTQSTGSPSSLGNINPALYRLARNTSDIFHDITAGDNKVACAQSSPGCVGGLVGFPAGPGYDLGTGLGSIDVNNFVTKWDAGSVSNTSISAPAAVTLGDTVDVKATVTGNGTQAPTGTVTFSANDTVIGNVDLQPSGNEASASVSVSAALLVAGNGAVSAVFNGDSAYAGSSASANVGLNLPATGALVVPFVTPNPVYQSGTTGAWTYTVSLTEKAGVAATLTGFTVSGNNDLGLFSTTRIPAKGAISAGISSTGLTTPVTRPFIFTGTDATGQNWPQRLDVQFLPSLGTNLAPGMTLTSATPTLQQNPAADSSCQWSHTLTVQETGGFEVTLSKLTVSGTDLTAQLPTIFGTQRLAAYGMLRGSICYPASAGPGTRVYALTGTSELGTTVTAALSTPFSTAPSASATFTASPQAVQLAVPTGSGGDSATASLTFAGGSPQWTVSTSPANRTSKWLTVSAASGTGNGEVKIQASAADLSPGVYNGVVTIQAPNAVPQTIAIPVSFTVNPSATAKITGLQNAFSFKDGFAPGMALSVYGTNLANSTTLAPKNRFPLPFVIAGVSAMVNGVSALLYFVSAGQVNIQIPYETGAGPAVVAINNNGQIASYPFNVDPAGPGLYTSAISNATGLPVTSATTGDVLLLFVTGEGDVTPSLATGATPSSTITDPAKLPHARQAISVSIGGVNIPLLFAGIPSGIAGLTQIDLQLPDGLPTGPQPVVVTVGGISSPPITLEIK